MIVSMKKASIIVLAKDAESALKELRRVGVLHIEHQEPLQGKDLSLLEEDLLLVDNCLAVFEQPAVKHQAKAAQAEIPLNFRATATHVVDLWKRYERLESFSNATLQAIAEWEKWGDFEPAAIAKLRDQGVSVKLYEVPVNQVNNFPKDVAVKKIYTKPPIAGCVVISTREFDCPFKEITPPRQSLSAMRARLSEDSSVMQSITGQIGRLGRQYGGFLKARAQLKKEIEFQRALCGMGRAGPICYLTGYAPVDTVPALMEAAEKNKWGILVKDPHQEDDIPTLIRNPKWVSVISPLFKFLEILPGYRELDVSLPFLIFFSIFFGILIGDAGYGLVYLLLTFWFQQRLRKKTANIPVFYLFYMLSGCAIVWGALTGTFFGQEWVSNAGYKPLVPALVDEKGMQRFCFFLGALHLSLAHAWRGLLKAPSPSALGDLGWMCILWAANFVAGTLILGDALPSFCAGLLITGVSLIVLFTNPQKNILKSAEEWIAWLVTLPLNFMSNFADVVSYVRLFAVGMAGVAIADAFNALARTIGSGGMLMIIPAAFIALLGNILAIVLGPVSVLVHGVRLNVLEFSLHGNISWSGKPYKPFEE